MTFHELPIGACFRLTKRFGWPWYGHTWIKLTNCKNPRYLGLDANCERETKTDQGTFAKGDADWAWCNANYEVKQV